MKEQILQLFNNKWLSVGEISEALGVDSKKISPLLKEMLSYGELLKTGERRGTKYALPGTPAASNKPSDLRGDTLAIIEAEGPIGRSELCKKLSNDSRRVYDIQLMEIIKSLLEENIIESNNKKKGVMFWIAGASVPDSIHEEPIEELVLASLKHGAKKRSIIAQELKTYDAKIKATLEDLINQGKVSCNNQKRNQIFWLTDSDNANLSIQELENSDGKPYIDSMEKLIEIGLSNIGSGVGFMQSELQKVVNDCSSHPFSQLQIINALTEVIQKKQHDLMYRKEYTDCGWHIMVYKGSMPEL